VIRRIAVTVLVLALGAVDASAQVPGLGELLPPGEGAATARIVQLVALLTVLSLAPGLLIMVTSFTRFIVALSFLRSGLGLQSTPANLILISLALFMTFFVMSPVFDRAWQDGLQPLLNEEIGEEEALRRVTGPFRDFMLGQVREKDLRLFHDIAAESLAASPGEPTEAPPPSLAPDGAAEPPEIEIDLRTLIPAFEMGFLIVLPFLIIDMIVATLTMSMGMMMLPPTVISLPFKILFFVLIDGWNLLTAGLVRSFF
jgi:flagellar biosynthetic protein FliP